MELLSTFSHIFFDFLFPKSDKAKDLESFSVSQMINEFPSPRPIIDDKVIAIFDYRDKKVKDLIWEIKYKGNNRLVKNSAQIIYEIVCHELAERSLSENFINPLLVPMPISKKKRRERGFNQTELLCEEISKLDAKNLITYRKDLLKKLRHTESQAHTHTKSERMENLKGSMAVANRSRPQNTSVVLIDDVYTTGASVNEARRALRDAGFKKVLAITLAH